MNMTKSKMGAGKLLAGLLAVALMIGLLSVNALAAGYEDEDSGWYQVDASMSAYVSAMGGVEFGAPLLTGAYVEVLEDGSAEMTLTLTKNQVTIYGITCYTFIDPRQPIQIKTNGAFADVKSYTTSSDTAEDPSGTMVNYVDSITFVLPSVSTQYDLSLYINSQVMGVQFGATQSSGATYYCTLSVDWDSLTASDAFVAPNTQTATVEYTVTGVSGGYEVSIPSVITVDASGVGTYEIEAVDFDIADDQSVSVSADAGGTLSNGDKTVDFENALSGSALQKTGDKLNGTVTITSTAPASGTYTGTIAFNITLG